MSDYNPERLYKTVPYAANSPVPISLPRGKNLRHLKLRLVGQLTVAATANTATLTKPGDEWAVATVIELKFGETVLYRVSGNQLRWINYFRNKAFPHITQTIGDSATANPSFDSVLKLDFWSPDLNRPMDTSLDTSDANVSDFTLQVTYGDHTSINASATAFTTAPRIEVYAYESDVSGNFDKDTNPYGFGAPNWKQNVTTWNYTFASSGSGQQYALPVNRYHRGFIFQTISSGVTEAPALITQWQLVRAGVTLLDLPESMVQQGPFLDRDTWDGQNRALNSGTSGIGRFGQSTSTDNRAWYFIDFAREGRLLQCLNTLGITEFNLVVTTSTTNVILNTIDLGLLPGLVGG